jgi:hypothetical protein
MKLRSLLLLVPLLVVAMQLPAAAQFAFGIEPFCATEKDYPNVSLPAATWAEIVKTSNEGIPLKDACVEGTPGAPLEGWQADFDNDGSQEVILLCHSGEPEAGCNAVAALAPMGEGKFRLIDMMAIPGGKAFIRPIVTLESGVQLYLQNTYTLPDGQKEVKGSILWLQQGSLIVLISWPQKAMMIDGKLCNQKVDAAFIDMNFDARKELYIRYTLQKGTGKLTSKNLLDRYVLTLDYLPNHLRYGIYDSCGFDKTKNAMATARAGERMLGKAETRDEGVAKIREGLRVDPFNNDSRVKLGIFFRDQGKYGDAEKTLLIAIAFDPTYKKAHKILGDTYLRLNDLEKALAAYTTYLSLNPPEGLDRRQAKINVKRITVWSRK